MLCGRDFTKKTGDKITAIKPNIQDKAANKVAGMVDIVARIIAEDDNRTLSFKNSEVVFGGGRLTVNERAIPLDYEAFLAVYDEANKNAVKQLSGEPVKTEEPKRGRGKKVEEPMNPPEEEETPMMDADETAPRTRSRRSSEPVQEEPEETPVEQSEPEQTQPVRTRRRRS